MTMMIAYIADAQETETFKWEYSKDQNLPKSISPELNNLAKLDFSAPERSKSDDDPTKLHYIQLDWGAYAAKVNKEQIKYLIDRNGHSKELDEFYETLVDDKEYAFIVAELY